MPNIVTPEEMPTTIPCSTQSLTLQHRSKHRAWIAVKAEAALHSYWQTVPSGPVKAEMMRDWADGLEDCSEGEIRAAFRKHLSENPKTRPNVGYIRQYVMVARTASKSPLSEDDCWRNRIRIWQKERRWSQEAYGSEEPDSWCTKIPKHILAEFGYGAVAV